MNCRAQGLIDQDVNESSFVAHAWVRVSVCACVCVCVCVWGGGGGGGGMQESDVHQDNQLQWPKSTPMT